MEIFKVAGFVLIVTILILVLKSIKREDMALYLTILASVILLTYMILKLDDVISLLKELVNKSNINSTYLVILLKVTGISYVVELVTNICKDAGSLSLATKMEMLGKVSIVILTIPILSSVIEVVIGLV